MLFTQNSKTKKFLEIWFEATVGTIINKEENYKNK